ncbi:hypothetical protein BHR52_01310 [Bordetella pertussis]|nr:hypothetical protein BHR52_01310 [Bordetella pertussis]
MAQRQVGQRGARGQSGIARRFPAQRGDGDDVVQGRGRLARQVVAFMGGRVRGQRIGAVEGARLRRRQLGRARRAGGQQGLHMALQRRQGVGLADSAQYVQRHDVAGAFPDRAEMRIAHQARLDPFFDIAAAAADLHRVAGHLARVAAGAELDQRREDARQRRLALAAVGGG